MKRIISFKKIFNWILTTMFVLCLFASSQTSAQDNDSTETKQDSVKQRKLSFDGYPYAFYTPETELAVGVGGIIIFYASDTLIAKPSQIELSGYYTTNKQYYISLDPEMYFFANKFFVSMPVNFGYYVTNFYGIGPSTVDTGNVNYTSKSFAGTLSLLGPAWWMTATETGFVFDYNNTEMVDIDSNSYLANNDILGSNGGEYFGIGTKAVWDTRDNIFYPRHGKYSSLKFVFYPVGNYNFYTTELDIKSYSTIFDNYVFAGELYFTTAFGDVPFYSLPKLGGQYRMRGFYEGRYVDNAYFTMQFELRHKFWWKFGYVVFGGFGTVASSPDKYQIKEMKVSYGAGLRFLFNEEEGVNLRMDFGITTEGDHGIYFGIGEAF